MDNIPVNWNALDALVLDYAEAEQLLVDSGKSMSSFVVRSTIGHIRRLIEQGSISEALALLRQHAPSVLQDQRLLFRLHKQKFIELLRSGDVHARNQAIQCSRTVLGPCALNAYPEAYEEFKRLLLALIYNKDDDSSPVVEEWSEFRRAELAATVASVLKAQLHAYDPLFSLALRYLVSTHNRYYFRQGLASPIAKVSDTLLAKEKDPPATLHDCLLEAPNFDESDVQALAQAVDLSRQGAVDSLRYAGGDLTLAFKNELSRIKLDTGVVDELVHGYCVYRGLIDGITSSVPSTDSQNIDIVPEPRDEQGSSARDESELASKAYTPSDISLEDKSGEATMQEHLGTFTEQRKLVTDGGDAAMEEQADTLSEQSVAGESAGADSCTASESICSTSDCVVLVEQKHSIVWKKLQPSCPRKRWKGRPMPIQSSNKEVTHLEEERHTSTPSSQSKGSKIDKFGLALEIRELACKGNIHEVIQKVKWLNPHFFECNPHLLFQLKQVEFLKLVEMGNYTEALGVARRDMGPLASRYTDLLKPLKETVLALARPQGESLVKPISPSMLGATLQVALSASLGVSEPDLMNIMKVTLHTHNEWFKLQMCTDPFADILNINALKDTESASLGCLCPNSISETSTISSKLGASKSSSLPNDGNLPQQSDSSRDGALFDDSSILTVMEWMALPRGDAIQLLAQYDGSVENVFEHVLS